MRILIITQSVDRKNPVLGFFHNWISALASRFEKITVICLGAGDYDLPENVRIFSLGKEKGVGKLGYLRNFYALIWKNRHEHDAVFVHMNEEYVILAGLLWRMWGKKIVLWRNHVKGTFLTRVAVLFSHTVLCTSPHSFTARFKKTSLCAAGIDTDFYTSSSPGPFNNPVKLLVLGRISKVKNVHDILEGLKNLETIPFICTVVGAPITADDEIYYKELQEKYSSFINKGVVKFVGDCTHEQTRTYFQSHDIYINATNSGSLDKTIIEAMASGCVPVIANESFKQWLPESVHARLIFKEQDPSSLTAAVLALIQSEQSDVAKIQAYLRSWVENEHSLTKLLAQISQNLTSK